MKWKVILFSLFLISRLAFGEWKQGYGKSGTEPDGFRGIKWGAKISTLSGMEHGGTSQMSGGIKYYIRKNDELKIGAAKLKLITYGFWQDKLCIVIVSTNDLVNWSALKDAVFQKFGEGCQENEYIEKYAWYGEKTGMTLEYNEISEQGSFIMLSDKIMRQLSAWNQRKAEEGAATGF
jgi:hypothetical protein